MTPLFSHMIQDAHHAYQLKNPNILDSKMSHILKLCPRLLEDLIEDFLLSLLFILSATDLVLENYSNFVTFSF